MIKFNEDAWLKPYIDMNTDLRKKAKNDFEKHFSIPELSKKIMHEFWYDYVKPKYDKKLKLCPLHTESFIVYIKTDDIYKDIAEDVETRFDTSNYELECNSIGRTLPKGKKQKSNWINERWIRWKNHNKICWTKSKTYSYLIDDGSEDKKAKHTKKCVLKRKLKFKSYKNCLETTQLQNKVNYLEKNKIKIKNIIFLLKKY